MKISELESTERPREMLLENGPAALSDAQLLAIILNTGTKGLNVVDTARRLLQEAGGKLSILGRMSRSRMTAIPGIGECKYVSIAAVMELGRRMAIEASQPIICINSPDDAYGLLEQCYRNTAKEECWCIFLKRSRKVIDTRRISSGTESITELDTKALIRTALDLKAASIILSHNHPSGSPAPSRSDITATDSLKKALATFSLSLIDHIVLGEGGLYYSFSENEVISYRERLSDPSRPCLPELP